AARSRCRVGSASRSRAPTTCSIEHSPCSNALQRAETLETEETSRPSLGYLVVLLGVAGWGVSCFRALYRITEAQTVRTTLVRQVSCGSAGTRVGGSLYLFRGIYAIVVFALVGVRVRQRWNVDVLAGAVVAWSL